MSSLPHEVLAEILSWLPVKSLLRFRSVSKSWRTLISDHHFIHLHLNHSTQTDKLSIFLKYGLNFFALRSPIDFRSPDHPAVQFHFPFNIHNPQSMTEIVGSCNGILCLSTFTNTIFLFNPSTRSYAQLPDTPAQFPGYGVTRFPVFGFGHSPVTHEYKVLRIVYFHPSGSTVDSYQVEAKIHTVGTSSWRIITEIPGDIRDRSSGILVNGHLHWIATPLTHPGSSTSTFTRVIVSFDVGNEEFGNLTLPHFDDGNYNSIFLGGLRGQLCMFRNLHEEFVGIWVMKEYGVGESWTQQFNIRHSTVFGGYQGWYFKPFRFLQDGKFLVRRSNGKPVIYDPRSDTSMDIVVRGVPDFFVVTDYVESLVSVNHEELLNV